MLAIEEVLADRGSCGVMLTGGKSAERLYRALAALEAFRGLAGVDFYFGDERCVAPTSQDSNYGLVMGTLFTAGVPDGCRVWRMKAEMLDREVAALQYEAILPERIDVLLLGVGEDGHIASLFPGSQALRETSRRVVAVAGPKPPRARLTITPSVVVGARYSFVLAPGERKAGLLAQSFGLPDSSADLPAKLAAGAVWLLDTPPAIGGSGLCSSGDAVTQSP